MEIVSTQHLSLSTQHPYEKYGSDISLSEAYQFHISPIEVKSQCWLL